MIARNILEARIAEIRESFRRTRLMRYLAIACALGIVVRGSLLVAVAAGYELPKPVEPWCMLGVVVGLIVACWQAGRSSWSDREIARQIEAKHPILNSQLLTAIDHEPDAEQPVGYLHERLIDQVLARAATQNWLLTVADRPYKQALMALVVTAFGLLITESALRSTLRPVVTVDNKSEATKSVALQTSFVVMLSPGDVEVERGSKVVVEARFEGAVPAEAALVLLEADGAERERLPLKLTVDQQVFGGMISKVDRDMRYRVEFAAQSSKEHQITVFDYPKLVRADVNVQPPAYTSLPAKEIKNTQKVSAMEGSTLKWQIHVNKPLAAAELFGEDKSILQLKPSKGESTVLVAEMTAEKSQKYRLHLVDEHERSNLNPPWFSVTVQANQLAKIEVVFPKRDVQVSAIQELPVEARVSDDLGVIKSGAVYSIDGHAKEVVFKHATTAPQKKQEVKTELALETERAQPRQLVSYYFWAEDTGPKGEVRRSMSDMFFADVRHFEDIFREMEAPPSEPGQPQSQSGELVDLQKQVVNATWRILRDAHAGRAMDAVATDVSVVQQSQGIVLEKTKEAMEKVEDAQVKQALTEAWKSMKDALIPLQQAAEEKKRTALNQALTFEQSALEWLHRAMSREHQVMRQNQRQQGAGQQANQNQIMDLELKQQEQRYEEEKTASEEQTAEQQENLQVLNRLKELARRQEALAEKMKQLQNQLAEAKTEEERQELENQLQRLQNEQEQLLRDLDELKDRMEKPENAQNMAEAREQLEQTREQVLQANEQLKEKQLTDATNAATRAQRELEKMQEDFRQKTSRKFADEVKQLRDQARAAAEREKSIGETLEKQKPTAGEPSADTAQELEKVLSSGQVGRQVEQQQADVEKLLNGMRQLSEQAEQSEPLLHRSLYDAVRKAQTNGLEEHLLETRNQLRYGTPEKAKEAERQVANSLDELQRGMEKAAEAVLGSESEALRMAKNELDKLIQEAQSQSEAKLRESGGQESPAKQAATAQADEKSASAQAGGGAKTNQKEGGTPEAQGGGRQSPQESASRPGMPSQQSGKGATSKPDTERKSQQASAGDLPAASTQQMQQGLGGPGQAQRSQERAVAEQAAQSEGESSAGGASAPQPTTQTTRGTRKGEESNRARDNQRVSGGPSEGRDADNDRFRPKIVGADVPESLFFEENSEKEDLNVFSGSGYESWADRLRNVEELLNNPELRNEAAKIFDRAREMRVETRRSNEAPQVAYLNNRITQPLVELRNRVMEELSKRDADKNLAPVDRDPVPAEYRDLVKRYYQELGAGK